MKVFTLHQDIDGEGTTQVFASRTVRDQTAISLVEDILPRRHTIKSLDEAMDILSDSCADFTLTLGEVDLDETQPGTWYTFTVAQSIRAYGTVEVMAASLKEAIAKVTPEYVEAHFQSKQLDFSSNSDVRLMDHQTGGVITDLDIRVPDPSQGHTVCVIPKTAGRPPLFITVPAGLQESIQTALLRAESTWGFPYGQGADVAWVIEGGLNKIDL